MSDSPFFIDTNILVYTIDKHTQKKEIALDLLCRKPIISTQVINELTNVFRKKFSLPYSQITTITENILASSTLFIPTYETIVSAYRIGEKYGYAYYDSLILASALENNCNILYSEDMHNGQLLEKNIKISNPFINIS